MRELVPAKASIVAIAHPVGAQEVAVVAEYLDEFGAAQFALSAASHLVKLYEDATRL